MQTAIIKYVLAIAWMLCTISACSGNATTPAHEGAGKGDKRLPPVADFTATPTTGEEWLWVDFQDRSTGSITKWEWDFDSNGSVDSVQQNPGYWYLRPGTYSVTLTVSGYGKKNVFTRNDYIYIKDVGIVEPDFVGSPRTGPAPLTVTFTDLTTGDPSRWWWDFNGDGVGDSTEQNPTHTYETPGTYGIGFWAANEISSEKIGKPYYIVVTAP